LCSFNVKGLHAIDVTTVLNQSGDIICFCSALLTGVGYCADCSQRLLPAKRATFRAIGCILCCLAAAGSLFAVGFFTEFSALPLAGVALRSGHHCTQPLHRKLGINASARASLYLYSTATDIDRFIEVLKDSVSFFRRMGL
jgi:hypothetical protein